jgi:hypothetical protein
MNTTTVPKQVAVSELKGSYPAIAQRLASFRLHLPVMIIMLGLFITASWIGLIAWVSFRVIASLFA